MAILAISLLGACDDNWKDYGSSSIPDDTGADTGDIMSGYFETNVTAFAVNFPRPSDVSKGVFTIRAYCQQYSAPSNNDIPLFAEEPSFSASCALNPPNGAITTRPKYEMLTNGEFVSGIGWSDKLCKNGAGYGSWRFNYKAEATIFDQFEDKGTNWVVQGPGGYLRLFDKYGIPCGHLWQLATASAKVYTQSTPMACSPGIRNFDLMVRDVVGQNASGDFSVQVVPISWSHVLFPERAWMRGINVTNWGDAKALHFAPTAMTLYPDGSVEGGEPLVAPSTIKLLPVGAATMNSQLVVSGLPEGGALPKIQLTWSCQSDSNNPHFSEIQDHNAYVANLSAWGVEHRFLFWDDPTAQVLRIAPVGRFPDAVHFPYQAVPARPGYYSFQGAFPVLDTVINGVFRRVDGDMEVSLDLNHEGLVPLTVSVRAESLSPIPPTSE